MSAVNHPSHYNQGKIEVVEAIEDWTLNYHLGNAVKYIARAGRKDPAKEIEDLEKAKWYLERKIENLKAAKEGRAPIRPNDMNPRNDEQLYLLDLKNVIEASQIAYQHCHANEMQKHQSATLKLQELVGKGAKYAEIRVAAPTAKEIATEAGAHMRRQFEEIHAGIREQKV